MTGRPACSAQIGRPTVADRLRRMTPGRAWRVLSEWWCRRAPTGAHRHYAGGGLGLRGSWASDPYRDPPILAARFPDGSAIALREPLDAYDA